MKSEEFYELKKLGIIFIIQYKFVNNIHKYVEFTS